MDELQNEEKRRKLELNITSTATDQAESEVTFKVVTNNGDPDSSEALIALKSIVARQLPKMPREYIVRLIFDRRHYSLVIYKSGRVVGGVCYRPYLEQRFGEIAFLAISGTEQVKGYGTLLMNNLKSHVQQQKLEYFLTYADNYAIGYFQKQGFTKNVVMPKERWVGFIKDYDGGTLMECYIHPSLNYLQLSEIVGKQRAFLYERIRAFSRANEILSGLNVFENNTRISNPTEIPGILSAGWTSHRLFGGTTERDRNANSQKLSQLLKTFIEKLEKHPIVSKQFKAEHTAALDLISNRMREGDYYRSKEMLVVELHQMVSMFKKYCNDSGIAGDSAEVLDKLVVDFIVKDLNVTVSSTSDKDNSSSSS